MTGTRQAVLALSGGVGGAKLSLGLSDVLPPEKLHILINTGDDFEHLGLYICPDIDTHLYTLSGRANEDLGWGMAGETWHTMEALGQLGGETWFRLGDRDMATHLWRTRQRDLGMGLEAITATLAERLGVPCKLHPMSEDPVRTTVHTPQGSLPFQHYFVRHRCEPAVTGFSFEGIAGASPNPRVGELLASGHVALVILCPSNPYVSVDPILHLPGLWQDLRDCGAPVVAVSPIVAGAALKGPTAKMMSELGVPATALGVAQHYCYGYPGLLDCFVVDESDARLAGEIARLGVEVVVTPTVMNDREDKRRLAQRVLEAGGIS